MTPLRYLSIKRNAELIKLACDECNIPKENMAEFMQRAGNFAWAYDTPRWASHMHIGSFVALAMFVRKLHSEIIDARTALKSCDPQTMRQRYTDSSSVQASIELKRCFPSLRRFHIDVSSRPSSEIHGKENPYENAFVIPVHWYRSVFSRGIASVNGGSGARFVLSAKPFNLQRLERDHIKAFQCRTVARHKGICSVQNEWVMRYSVDDLSDVMAVHNSFSNCESLLNRRIRDKVDRMLDAL